MANIKTRALTTEQYKLIIVTETDDDAQEDADAYILKDLSKDTESDAVYEIVEDDDELDAVSKIFAEILDDINLDK